MLDMPLVPQPSGFDTNTTLPQLSVPLSPSVNYMSAAHPEPII